MTKNSISTYEIAGELILYDVTNGFLEALVRILHAAIGLDKQLQASTSVKGINLLIAL